MLYSDLPLSFSYLALYTFCNTRNKCHSEPLEINPDDDSFIHLRQPYPADKLADLLAVCSVTSLRQSSEQAALHPLLAGCLVFALGMNILNSICIIKVIKI